MSTLKASLCGPMTANATCAEPMRVALMSSQSAAVVSTSARAEQEPSQAASATFARDEGYLNRYILPVFGELALGEVSVGLVRSWIANLTASGLAPATVVKAGQILNKILRAAVEEGMIGTNAASAVRLPRVERHEMRHLSPFEVARLADAIDPRYRAVVFLGAYGGLRAGELFGLRVGRLDLPGQRVEVVEQVVEISGNLHVGAPKTRAGRRTVPVPTVVCEALSEHLRLWPSDGLIFTAPDGVRPADSTARLKKRERHV